MKVIRSALARTIWMIDPIQFNPDGHSLYDVYRELGQRYHFSKFPAHPQDFNKDNALEFTAGTFRKTKKEPLGIGLILYNNAVVGDSLSNTDDSELFLKDVADWALKEHELALESVVVRKAYLTNLDVKFDREPLLINQKLNFIGNRLYKQGSSTSGKTVPFTVGGIQFWTENAGTSEALTFRLERKLDTDFEKNIYFSTAPLSTQEHVALLQEIEAALKKD